MPELLENLLWCAALATWLMLLGGFLRAIFWPRATTKRLGSNLVRSVLAASTVLATLVSWWARTTSKGGENGS
jgi:hypothetical protein